MSHDSTNRTGSERFHLYLTLAGLIAALGLFAACTTAADDDAVAGDDDDTIAGEPAALCELPDGAPAEMETAKLYVEHNATDEDTGVHGLFDDTGWSELCVFDPSGALVLRVTPQGALGDLTMAGFFFESREPPNDEFSVADLEADFDEGEYEVVGTTYEGVGMVGAATFSHDIPVEPEITWPPLVDDEEEPGIATVPTTDFVVTWEPVTETLGGDGVTITSYEVIVTKEDHEDDNGLSRPIYDVHVAGDQTSLSVPEEFFEADELYELEVLALEVTGNQTISVGFFLTE